MISAFTSIYLLFYYQIIEQGALLGLFGLPLAVYYSYQVMTKFDTRELANANWGTIGIHSITGSLLIIGMYL